MQIVDDGEKKKGIHHSLNHFGAGDVFYFSRKIAGDGVEREGNNRPTDRRPKNFGAWHEPEARSPECHDSESHPLNDVEGGDEDEIEFDAGRGLGNPPECQRSKNQNGEHQY